MECQPAYPHQEVDVALTAPLLWGGSQCFKRDLLKHEPECFRNLIRD
jgi:hypothetical protein